MRPVTTLRLTFLLAAFAAGTAHAQVPSLLNYQGRVTVGGTNFNGTGQFKFALVDGGTNIAQQATATAVLEGNKIAAINVIDGGQGYDQVPTVKIQDPTGSGASATAVITGVKVSDIIVNTMGSGYTSPTVIIGPPSPVISYRTYWNNSGATNSAEPAASVALPVAQGLYATLLGDTSLPNMAAIPPAVFTNASVNLRVWFRPGASGSFTELSPNQRLGAAGYALRAASADAAAFTNIAGNFAIDGNLTLGGTLASASGLSIETGGTTGWSVGPQIVVSNVTSRNIVGGYSGNHVSNGVTGATISGGGNTSAGGGASPNIVGGNFGTIAGGAGNTAAGAFAVVGGGQNNSASAAHTTVAGGTNNTAGNTAATVSGGIFNSARGDFAAIGGGRLNTALTNYATIAGGQLNTNSGFGATIGGGQQNTASIDYATIGGGLQNTNSGTRATIGGGQQNTASSTYATIGGGLQNTASGTYATIGGGDRNTNSGNRATIGGGERNTASSNYATVPGGLSNTATGLRSFAAGVRAKATNTGSFVWNSDATIDFSSVTNNSFRVNAPGGAWFSHDVSVETITIRGGADLAEPFETGDHPVDPGTVLVIDPARPGHLMPSVSAYDTRVAGVASGAAGINAGIILRQEGRLDRGVPVALSGRVYVNADADYGAIQPGDLLVTSDTPGHAQRASDHARANGAVLGKAMSPLPAGRGQVLVLVGLQ
jgi:hypothetical protein